MDSVDKNQIMERSRVSDNNLHLTSKAQAPQSRTFTLEIFLCVIQPDFVGLQEAVARVARVQAEQLPQLGFRQPARLVFFKRKSF